MGLFTARFTISSRPLIQIAASLFNLAAGIRVKGWEATLAFSQHGDYIPHPWPAKGQGDGH